MAETHPRSIKRRVTLSRAEITVTGSGTTFYLPVPCNGVIDNIKFQQVTAGTTGTSWTVATNAALRRRLGVSNAEILATAPVVTLAAGAMAGVETSARKDAMATPSGCTKPVLSATLANRRVKAGDVLSFNFSHTGAYSPFPVCGIEVSILPTP